MHNMEKTTGELHALLIEYEKGLPKNDATSQVMAIQSGRIQKANKKSLNAKGKEVGHWKRNCHVYLAELIKKKKQVGTASSSSIFTIELFSFPKNSWVYDTGCGTHICNTKQGLRGARKLKQGALYLFVGNGVHAQVEAIGSYDLVLPSGLVICLDNCHYAPSITRVSKNNVLYFNTISSDGIYEIDMLNLVPNVNSIYNDSYFITFTDDYSHYDYMYLLKHKHEVFKMFKVFKNEVGNQLGKTIKILQSDRGGEYISQEFKDYLKACGIVQQLTHPYTPQHNGVSERRNRTLLDMVRSTMDLITLPLSFWDYALETAIRILNMVPNKKALVKRDTPDKLQQRSVKCIFIRYPKKTMGYYFYFPPENKIIVAGYAEFLKKNLLSQEVSGRAKELEEIQDKDTSKGYTQTYGVDYEETISPVADIRAIRILIAIAAFYDYEIWQMDVKTAFLNGYLNEDIYMVQPEGFVDPNHPRKLCKLQRSIYGFKQASRS
ncbi:retrotransposon protein, putative, ty1-copia subclass [Tanacetum coccineum]